MRSNRRYYRNYQYGKKKGLPFKKIILFVLFVWLFVSLIDQIALTTYRTSSTSMEPTIPVGTYFLATPIAYGSPIPFTDKQLPPMRTPDRGDLVIVKPSGISENKKLLSWVNEIIGFFTLNNISIDSSKSREWENREVVKRIIAVPGDTVKMNNFRVKIKTPDDNGFRSENDIIENFDPVYHEFPEDWDESHPFSGNVEELTLGEDEFFILSDNRGIGMDSTYLGPIKRDEIVKFLFLKYWPWPLEILR